jgi:hypothetical protein
MTRTPEVVIVRCRSPPVKAEFVNALGYRRMASLFACNLLIINQI